MNKLGARVTVCGLLTMQLLAGACQVFAKDIKIPVPQRSVTTPTQKLNREGVAELKRGHREKAKKLFYRAYLLDPGDPFTLNNLGYVAELDGDADRALRYYKLAAQDHTDAIIEQSSDATLRGKPLDNVFRDIKDSDHEISRISEQAIVLLQDGRPFEARNLLRSFLPVHPQDPFLLNNLGYAMESVGDLEGALRYYSAAASVHSTKPVVVTPRLKWRGRPISEVASQNALAVSQQIARGEGIEAVTARLNLRGVGALNDNDPASARKFFLEAYQRNPQDAFTLNNLGYISELDGDWEGAESFYEAARSGRDANDRVRYSTRRDVEGEKIDSLADNNQFNVASTLKAIQATRRRTRQPVELIPRNSSPKSEAPEAKPVPPVGIQAPSLPALPVPGSEPNRGSQPEQPPQPQNSPHSLD